MTFNRLKTTINLLMLLMVASVSVLIFSSCEEEEGFSGEPYFIIEDNPTGINAGVEGVSQKYVVRSNRPWQIVPQGEYDWVKTFPEEGDADGIFQFIVDANPTFDGRTASFAFVVNGQEQPVLFNVEQGANVPYINIEEESVEVASGEEPVTLTIDANVNWTYSVDVDWLSEVEVTEEQLKLSTTRNTGLERSATVTITTSDAAGVSAEVMVTQLAGNILIVEDFNWLEYGNAIPYETSGETRYDNWTDEEKARGWYSTPNSFSNDQQIVYARQGFVKLGKTNYGGDLISPKMDIVGTVNLKVTFKAAVYISAGGTVDDNILRVNAVGAGTTSVAEMAINNVPNNRAQDEEGIGNDIWAEDRAYSFTISGATADTQIRFLGGDFDLNGVGKGKNRIFLDDITVEIID
ncbi:BACON domain-containing protein [Marinoscillum pacificum]|uniref:BACON domain-containing protein n=1 Tax=Marinoscillum pacificum TaxID=392723 RepID=UPI0021578B90|nr:BACON domain-containing protein [Marinoscillum pacificum]